MRLNKYEEESSIDEDGIPRRDMRKKQSSNKDDGLKIERGSDVSDS